MSSTSAKGLTVLGSTLLGLSTVSIALRFYARRVQKARVMSDDLIMIPCLMLLIGATSCTFFGVHKRVLGYPTPRDPEELANSEGLTTKINFIFGIFAITTLGCTKTGALLFFRRIFFTPNLGTFFARLTWITVAVVVLWTLALNIVTVFSCGTHFVALLQSSSPKAVDYCYKTSQNLLVAFAISDLLLEAWIILLPSYPVYGMQASLKRRLGIMGVFLLALVGFAACIARLVVTIQIVNPHPKSIVDYRLVNTKQTYLTLLEAGLTLVAVNLPSLWCLFTKIRPRSIFRSIWSMLSPTPSLATTSSSKPSPYSALSPRNQMRKASNSSDSHLAILDAHPFDTFAMRDVEETDIEARLPQGETQTKDDILQSTAYFGSKSVHRRDIAHFWGDRKGTIYVNPQRQVRLKHDSRLENAKRIQP